MLSVDGEQPTRRYLETRRRILEVAAIALREKGYYGARLVDIADAADMRTTSIYYYFPSKDDLVAEVFRIGVTTTMGHVEHLLSSVGPDAHPLDRLAAMIRGHLHVALGSGPFVTATTRVLGQAPPSVHDRFMEHQNEYAALWRRELGSAVSKGAIRHDLDQSAVRMLVAGALNWTSEWFVAGGPLTIDELADTATGMIIGGLRRTAEPTDGPEAH